MSLMKTTYATFTVADMKEIMSSILEVPSCNIEVAGEGDEMEFVVTYSENIRIPNKG